MEPKKTMYVKGIRTFAPNQKAPDFVLGSGVITIKELKEFLDSQEVAGLLTQYQGNDQLRIQFLKSDKGGISVTVDTWKPTAQKSEPVSVHITPADNLVKVDDDLPF